MADMEIKVVSDTASPAIRKPILSPEEIKRAVGGDCVRLTQRHLLDLPHNKMGWPPVYLYAGAARNTAWEPTNDGVVISTDNEERPGAMRQRFRGGTIRMKDKLLTIPARAEFYGHSATEFDNLRFVPFASGAKALVIWEGGTGQVNFQIGRSQPVTGAGTRSAMMVAYWLVEEVTQEGNPDVLPDEEEYAETALEAVATLAEKKGFK